jgi:D-cysteine desulfhydrase family pyridoxal phosphate-dependent enzyme
MYFNPKKLNKLNEALDNLKRVKLGVYPTPLHDVKNISKILNGPRILFKREDLSGLAFGGNKTRMFEYSLAKAIDSNCDCVIAGSAVQSNYCRQLSAACAKYGLELYLILRPVRGKDDFIKQGNVLLDYLAGANVKILEEDSVEKQQKIAKELENSLRKEGRKPYIARDISNGDIGLEASAYVKCLTEIIKQTEEEKIDFNYIFLSSQDSTQGGLLFGAEFIESDLTIIGINPTIEDNAETEILSVQEEISRELNLELKFNKMKNKIINLTDYAGKGYGIPSKEGIEAIKLVAKTEGIFLDPVYTGKAMAGLIDYIRKGKITKNDSVIFIHTGGNPALFAYSNELGI